MGAGRRRIAAVFATSVSLSVGLAASDAGAQEGGPLYYSDDAALLAGAATALPADPASVFYNPAGLGAIKRARVSVNGSIFSIRIRSLDRALTTTIAGTESELSFDSVDFISAPTGVTAAFSVHPAVKLGAGFYTTERDVVSAVAEDDKRELGDGESTLTQRIDLQSDRTKYHAGVSAGFAITDTVRLGVGIFGIYSTQDAFAQYSVELDTTDPVAAFETVTARIALSAWGIQPVAGFQWDATRAVHLSLVARAPEFLLSYNADSAGTVAAASNFEGANVVALELFHEEGSTDATDAVQLMAPARFVLGAALDPTPLVRVALEAELAMPMENQVLGIDRDLVVNGRLGVRAQATPELVLGGGFFTDLASEVLADDLGSTRVDFVGATFGGTLLTPLSVADNKSPDALILSTTLAVSYSLGFGKGRTIETDGSEVEKHTRDVLHHYITPYTGSAILF